MRPLIPRTLCEVTPTGVAFALAGACAIDSRGAAFAAAAWLIGEAIHRALFTPPTRRCVSAPVRLPAACPLRKGGRDAL